MEPEGSLPQSEGPATCPYPERARSSPYPQIPHPYNTNFIPYVMCYSVFSTNCICHIVCVSLENFAVLGYYAASGGNSLPMFQDNLSGPFFNGQESRKYSCPLTIASTNCVFHKNVCVICCTDFVRYGCCSCTHLMGFFRSVESDVASDARCPLSHLNQICQVSIKSIISVAYKASRKFLQLFSSYLLQADRQTDKPWRNQNLYFFCSSWFLTRPKWD